MLQELGQWVIHAAYLLQAPAAIHPQPFPQVPSRIGNWFLQMCSTAHWTLATLQDRLLRTVPFTGDISNLSTQVDKPENTMEEINVPESSMLLTNMSNNDSFETLPLTNEQTNHQLSKSFILTTLQESSNFKTQNTSEQEVTVINIQLTESSSNGSQNKSGNPVNSEVPCHSNESEKKTVSEMSRKTFPTVKQCRKTPTVKRSYCSLASAVHSSEEFSLSVGSLDSVFSVPESSDTANVQASSLSDDNRPTRKVNVGLMDQKDAEEKLIAILDGLKEKLLNVDPISPSNGNQ